MLTLKNVFWVVLVLLNLTFILAVSYSRLKPEPETSPYQWDTKKVANEESAQNTASWRFATVNTADIPALELLDTSSPETVTTESDNNALTVKPEPEIREEAPVAVDNPPNQNKENEASSPFSANTIEVAAARMDVSHGSEMTLLDSSKKQTEKAKIQNSQTAEDNYKVDTYYDGNLVRTEETDNEGNLLVTVKETMEGLGKLSTNDANYVKALKQLDNSKHAPKINETDATHYQVKENNSEKSVDYFNKIDVSNKSTPPSDNMTLAKQIEAALSTEDSSNRNDSAENKFENNYFQTLGTESAERTNQMRTIKIARGDTLWD
ncbi:MAG: hypothetical protein DSZ28_00800, partial [Thiothrix sp.]